MSLHYKKMVQVLIRVRSSDKIHGKRVAEELIELAEREKLAGASIWQCIRGLGDHGRYSVTALDITPDLPLIVELVDEPLKIEQFIPILKNELGDKGLITITAVNAAGSIDTHTDIPHIDYSFLLSDQIWKFVQNLEQMSIDLKLLLDIQPQPSALEDLQRLEHENDILGDRMTLELARGIFLPVNREDFARLLQVLAKSSDALEGVAHRIVITPHLLPDEFYSHITQMIEYTHEACKLLANLARKIDEEEKSHDWEEITKIRKIEEDVDTIHRKFLHSLYTGNYNPLHVIQAKDIDQYLEDAVDELYRCFLALRVLKTEYHDAMTEKRIYLP